MPPGIREACQSPPGSLGKHQMPHPNAIGLSKDRITSRLVNAEPGCPQLRSMSGWSRSHFQPARHDSISEGGDSHVPLQISAKISPRTGLYGLFRAKKGTPWCAMGFFAPESEWHWRASFEVARASWSGSPLPLLHASASRHTNQTRTTSERTESMKRISAFFTKNALNRAKPGYCQRHRCAWTGIPLAARVIAPNSFTQPPDSDTNSVSAPESALAGRSLPNLPLCHHEGLMS